MTPEQLQAIKAIKTLATVALDREDVELLHKHFREILRCVDKALKPPAQ